MVFVKLWLLIIMSSGLISQLKNLDEVGGEVAHKNEKILDEIKKLGTRRMAKMPAALSENQRPVRSIYIG